MRSRVKFLAETMKKRHLSERSELCRFRLRLEISSVKHPPESFLVLFVGTKSTEKIYIFSPPAGETFLKKFHKNCRLDLHSLILTKFNLSEHNSSVQKTILNNIFPLVHSVRQMLTCRYFIKSKLLIPI